MAQQARGLLPNRWPAQVSALTGACQCDASASRCTGIGARARHRGIGHSKIEPVPVAKQPPPLPGMSIMRGYLRSRGIRSLGASNATNGCLAVIPKRMRAAPVGRRRRCSRARTVETATPIRRAKLSCLAAAPAVPGRGKAGSGGNAKARQCGAIPHLCRSDV